MKKCSSIKPEPKRRNTLKLFLDNLDDKEEFQIHEFLLQYLIAYNIPFESMESNYFIKFCKKLRPAYHPPSSTLLANDVLSTLYGNCRRISSKLSCCGVLLINRRNDSEFVSMVFNESNQYLYVQKCDEKEYFEEFLLKSIKTVKANHNVDIHAIIFPSRNFSSVSQDENQCWNLICISNNIQRLIRQIIIDNQNEINCFLADFNVASIQDALLKEGGEKVMDLSDDSYNNIFKVLIPCCNNIKIVRKLLINDKHRFFSADLINLLFQSDFELKLQTMIHILKRLYEMSHYEKKNDYSLADAIEDWIELKCNYKDSSYIPYIDKEIMGMTNNIALAAHYLHPIYKGDKLKWLGHESMEMMHLFLIDELDEKAMDGLLKFESKKGIFASLLKKNYESPILFWQAVEPMYASLAKFCLKLLRIPAYTIHQDLVMHLRENLNTDQQNKVDELYFLLKCNEISKKKSQ